MALVCSRTPCLAARAAFVRSGTAVCELQSNIHGCQSIFGGPEQRMCSRTALQLCGLQDSACSCGFRFGLVGFSLQGLEQRLRAAEQRLWAPEKRLWVQDQGSRALEQCLQIIGFKVALVSFGKAQRLWIQSSAFGYRGTERR